jgi:hypothetical protein
VAVTRARLGGPFSTSIHQNATDEGDLQTRGSTEAGPVKPLQVPGADAAPPSARGEYEASTKSPISMMATQMLAYTMEDRWFLDAPVDAWQLQWQAMPLGIQSAPVSKGISRIGVFAVRARRTRGTRRRTRKSYHLRQWERGAAAAAAATDDFAAEDAAEGDDD